MSTLALWLKTYNEDAAHRDLYGAAGMDVAAVEDWPLARVICPSGAEVTEGESCASCPHGCLTPGDDCPGR